MRHWSLNSASHPVLTQLARPSPSTESLSVLTHLFAGTGDCDGAVKGANGQPVKVPCSCPPDRATFMKVRAKQKHSSIQFSP
jgi:hypothetical protein